MSALFLKALHLVCLSDDARPNLALIGIEKGNATASNGDMLLRVNLREHSQLEKETIDNMDGKFIHMEVWKDIHKAERIWVDDNGMLNADVNDVTKTYKFSEPGDLFPSLNGTVADLKASKEGALKKFGVNQKLLNICAKVFGNNDLYFHFHTGGNVLVHCNDEFMFAIITKKDADGVNRIIFE
jgi:uncharacterized protein (DUF952 family)